MADDNGSHMGETMTDSPHVCEICQNGIHVDENGNKIDADGNRVVRMENLFLGGRPVIVDLHIKRDKPIEEAESYFIKTWNKLLTCACEDYKPIHEELLHNLTKIDERGVFLLNTEMYEVGGPAKLIDYFYMNARKQHELELQADAKYKLISFERRFYSFLLLKMCFDAFFPKYVEILNETLGHMIRSYPGKLKVPPMPGNLELMIVHIRHLNRRRHLFRLRLRQLIHKMQVQDEILACPPRAISDVTEPYFAGGQDYLNLVVKYSTKNGCDGIAA